MQKITFDKVRKTYNGRTGCACGCNGKYTIPSHVSIEEANKETGWDAYDADDVSDRRAKMAMTKVNKAIDEYGSMAKMTREGVYEYYGNDVWFCYSETFVAINTNGRATTVYF